MYHCQMISLLDRTEDTQNNEKLITSYNVLKHEGTDKKEQLLMSNSKSDQGCLVM